MQSNAQNIELILSIIEKSNIVANVLILLVHINNYCIDARLVNNCII